MIRKFKRFILDWRINHLREQCSMLQDKIDYWNINSWKCLKDIEAGGLPLKCYIKIGSWEEKLSVLLIRKAKLEKIREIQIDIA